MAATGRNAYILDVFLDPVSSLIEKTARPLPIGRDLPARNKLYSFEKSGLVTEIIFDCITRVLLVPE